MKTQYVPKSFKHAFIAEKFNEGDPFRINLKEAYKSFVWIEGGGREARRRFFPAYFFFSFVLLFLMLSFIPAGYKWYAGISMAIASIVVGFFLFYLLYVPTSDVGADCYKAFGKLVEQFRFEFQHPGDYDYAQIKQLVDTAFKSVADTVVQVEGSESPSDMIFRVEMKQKLHSMWYAAHPFRLVSKGVNDYLKEAGQRKKEKQAAASKKKPAGGLGVE